MWTRSKRKELQPDYGFLRYATEGKQVAGRGADKTIVKVREEEKEERRWTMGREGE